MADESAYPIVVEARLEHKAYRKLLATLGVFRLRFVGPILAFLAFGALGAGRNEQALFLFLSLGGVALIIWLWASWQANSPVNHHMYYPNEYTFSDKGIDFVSHDESGKIPWEVIKRWRYMSGHYLLHVTSASFVAIPSACVEPDDIGPLEELFAEKIRKGPRGKVR